MADSSQSSGAGKPAPSKNVFLAVLGVLAGGGAFWGFVTFAINRMDEPHKQFETAYTKMLESLNLKPPDFDLDRRDVGTAYDLAVKPPWKCRVVHVVVNSAEMTIKIAPINVYDDYTNHQFPKACERELTALAQAIASAPAFEPYRDGARPAADDKRATQLHVLADAVSAEATRSGQQGWVYLGRSDASGTLTDTRIVRQTIAKGRLVTTQDISLMASPPIRAYGDPGSKLGRISSGSTITVLEVRQLAEPTAGAKGSYTWARVRLESQNSVSATVGHERLVRRRLVHRIASSASTCPLFAETNSLHSATQKWVYVGQKVQGDDAFVAGTARLDTPCVPRDGAVARITASTKVYVGADPHWPPPGVHPNGQVLAAGTNVQVVGDVSGYPFDATADPRFCERDPRPQHYPPKMKRSHQKRYCVYIPIVPM